MKKLSLGLFAICMIATLFPAHLSATNETRTTPLSAPKPNESTEATLLISRLEVIKEMDFKLLKGAEKKELRKEVRAIKKSLAVNNGGVYLSVGAIIIIVLLLILLL